MILIKGSSYKNSISLFCPFLWCPTVKLKGGLILFNFLVWFGTSRALKVRFWPFLGNLGAPGPKLGALLNSQLV